MANTYKNIIITPNRDTGSNVVPTIQFSGGNATVNTDIYLRVYPTTNGTVSFEGSAGQLLSVTNDLSNVIFSVNDVSGVPSLDANANGVVRITPFGGNVIIGTSTIVDELTGTNDGATFYSNPGVLGLCANGNRALFVKRRVNDGALVNFVQDNVTEGTISVSGTTVTYGTFSGSHWSQLADNSRPEILRGTVVETINEKCYWPDQQNDQLVKFKISDTPGSNCVYGVFMSWDNDDTENNDAYITSLGAYLIRIAANVSVVGGNLLESNGDGCARVQDDNIIRASTIGKATSNVVTDLYEDGSYTVPCVLYCG